MPSPLACCPRCGASNDGGAADCAACGQALASDTPSEGAGVPMPDTQARAAPQGTPRRGTPQRRMSRRAALWRALGIAGGVALLPIGGLAAYLAYRKSTDPNLLTHSGQYATAAAWSPDGTRVASVGTNGVQVWEALTDTRVLTVRPKDDPDDVVWSTDGRRLLTLLEKFDESAANSATTLPPLVVTVEVWDAATGQRMQSIRLDGPGPGDTGSIQVRLNEPYLAVVRQSLQDHVIEIWDVATGRMITSFRSRYDYPIQLYPTQLLWAPDRRRLATLSSDDASSSIHVEIWDAPAGRRLAAFTVPMMMHTIPVWASVMPAMIPAAWLPDEQSLALGLDVYAIDTGLRSMNYRADGHAVVAVAWSPDGRRLAVATAFHGIGLYAPVTNTIFVLDAADGGQRLNHDAGGSLGLELAFSPNGRYLLVTTGGDVEVWRSA